MKSINKDLLKVNIYETRDEMGLHAAKEVAEYIRELMKKQEVLLVNLHLKKMKKL